MNDSSLFITNHKDEVAGIRRVPEVNLRFFVDSMDPMFQTQSSLFDVTTETVVNAHTALFGADPSQPPSAGKSTNFGHGGGVRIIKDPKNPQGCLPYEQSYEGEVLLTRRGDCTFLEKLIQGKAANASGVVVISDEERPVTPSADDEALKAIGDKLDDVSVVVLVVSTGI